MRATILTTVLWALVSMMTKGCIVAWVLPLRCFLYLLPNCIYVNEYVSI